MESQIPNSYSRESDYNTRGLGISRTASLITKSGFLKSRLSHLRSIKWAASFVLNQFTSILQRDQSHINTQQGKQNFRSTTSSESYQRNRRTIRETQDESNFCTSRCFRCVASWRIRNPTKNQQIVLLWWERPAESIPILFLWRWRLWVRNQNTHQHHWRIDRVIWGSCWKNEGMLL